MTDLKREKNMTTQNPKYRPFPAVKMTERAWPARVIDKAPTWCSVDLRDGNQALAVPMSVEEKIEYFEMLVKLGFKEIEIGFPSASQIEFDFTRRLIEEKRIPEGVWVQTLVQCKEELIHRTFESLQGAPRAIVHLYNSTSVAQRRIVFGLDQAGIMDIAVKGTRHIRERLKMVPETKIRFQYSPESFSGTEVEFALEICEAVSDEWGATAEEWFVTHQKHPERHIISLHTHNDRGTGVAATELGLLAGATRVEGTLFGNGERTGNLDIVTVALNMQTQGIDSGLDFSSLPAVRDLYERTTKLEVPPRWPYGGDLVFTAFSGSHQDAINKGLKDRAARPNEMWEVPYLAIDPHDIGRNYRAIIRINSQSGKGGVAYVMEQEFGYVLPKAMHRDFGKIINRVADERGEELPPEDILELFKKEYLDRDQPLSFQGVTKMSPSERGVECIVRVRKQAEGHQIRGLGNGPVAAFVHGLNDSGIVAPFEVVSYSEHSLGTGAEAKAVAYFEVKSGAGATVFGAATDTNIEIASLKAILSALNRCTV
jgi:2-isopropylmalate synthase